MEAKSILSSAVMVLQLCLAFWQIVKLTPFGAFIQCLTGWLLQPLGLSKPYSRLKCFPGRVYKEVQCHVTNPSDQPQPKLTTQMMSDEISDQIESSYLGVDFHMERSMEGDQVKVLSYWASPFSQRVQIALDLKGIPYEYVEEDLLNNKSQLLLQSNPVHNKVPVLIHNGQNICESFIILEYIDETWECGVSLLPKNPYQRALVRFWAAFIDDKLCNSLSGMYRCPEGEPREKAKNETVANISLLEEAFGAAFDGSKGNPFFGGECIGYLDIVLGALVMWFQVVEAIIGVKLIDPYTTPLLHAWLHRFCRVDCVKKSLPQFQKLLTYGYLVQKMFPLLTYP